MNVTPQLLALSGMAYHGGKTADHWLALVGVDPRKVQGIEVRNGLCYWTKRAENACQWYWVSQARDAGMLIGRC